MTTMLTGVTGRVTFAVLAVTAVVYSALGTVGFVMIADNGRDAIEERIDDVLDQLESAVRAHSGTVDIATADGVTAVVAAPSDAVADGDGEIVVTRAATIDGAEVVLVGRSSQARLTDSLRSLFRGLWIAVPLAAVISALLAGAATRRALRPVGSITELAATIGPSPSGARVPVPATGDEIERLALTVNAMLERIDNGHQLQRRFTSDAAHELRTPLMALQGELELAVRDADAQRAAADPALLGRLQALTVRLGERIDDLVLLSTLDEARPLSIAPASLLDIAREEADDVAPHAIVDGTDATVPLDRELIGRAVRNLLANAVRHAHEKVVVSVDVGLDRVIVHVDDDGPGIPADQRSEVFGRFARLDDARGSSTGGSGLGLAIVAAIAAAHGGGVEATDSPTGGARLTLWLPLPTEA